jgi:hypothetical protein
MSEASNNKNINNPPKYEKKRIYRPHITKLCISLMLNSVYPPTLRSLFPLYVIAHSFLLFYSAFDEQQKTKILNNNMNPFQFKSSIFPHRSTTPHYILLDECLLLLLLLLFAILNCTAATAAVVYK